MPRIIGGKYMNEASKVFQEGEFEKQKEKTQKLPQKENITSENFEKKIQDGVKSGNYVAYKASDLCNN